MKARLYTWEEMMKEPTEQEIKDEQEFEDQRRKTELKKQNIKTSKMIKDFSQWAVTSYGIECRYDFEYAIEKDRLDEDWLSHMLEKWWVFPDEFEKALNFAREYYQIEQTELYD